MICPFLKRFSTPLIIPIHSLRFFLLYFTGPRLSTRNAPAPAFLPAPGSCSPHETMPILGVDLPELLFTVDIRLVDGVHPAAAQIVTAIAALTAAATGGQALPDNLFTLLPGGIPNQNRSHLRCSLSGLRQHILGKNTVALSGVVDHHMGHSAHQLAVLQNGAAAHALHYAAGGLQQLRVGNAQEQAAGRILVTVDLDDLHLILPDLITADGGTDHGSAGFHFLSRCHRHSLPRGEEICVGHGAEYTAVTVHRHRAHIPLHGKIALELAGISPFALLHCFHGGL